MLRYRARMGRELCVTYNKIGNYTLSRLVTTLNEREPLGDPSARAFQKDKHDEKQTQQKNGKFSE